ncbi:SIMPL domain-containing protein [Thalassobacter stenotrophicus]|uniref:SIMPL domain-containing protein n=1 Tax=Thalassobacter stenotrophicus TaxID=266809 RepID=UPI0022A8E692|nr:SIMPL domain-containing protein [Thalassobacter stenotrophicus]UYP66882.1 SIMPL domain-containing protein [Thalassobacter stenotrophicus]
MRLNVLSVAAALVVAMAAAFVAPVRAETLLQVTGEGRMTAAPDMAVISLRVSREGATAAGVTAEMAAAARAVLAALEAQGVAERDVQTTALQLNPRWTRPADGQAPRIVGYEAATGFEVRIRDLDRFGAVLDAVISDGANGFQGVRFALTDPRPMQDGARVAAFDDAMAKARLYAEASGMMVGDIRSIREGTAGPRPMAEGLSMRAMAGDVPVAAGELDVVMHVSLEVVLVPAP